MLAERSYSATTEERTSEMFIYPSLAYVARTKTSMAPTQSDNIEDSSMYLLRSIKNHLTSVAYSNKANGIDRLIQRQ